MEGMSTSPESIAATVWESVEHLDPFREGAYSILRSKDGRCTLATKGGEPAIIKIEPGNPRIDDAIPFESLIAAELTPRHGTAPVELPRLIEGGHRRSHLFSALSFVEGRQLNPNFIAQSFSPDDQRRFGATVADFVNWFSQAMPFAMYEEVVQDSYANSPNRDLALSAKTFDSEWYTKLCKTLQKNSYPALAALMDDVRRRYLWWALQGSLTPSFIGHRDLLADNLAFRHSNGQWELTGIFDLGQTGPTSFEREISHLPALSHIATEAAIDRYETTTGRTVNRGVVQTLADAQVGLRCTYAVLSDEQYIAQHKVDYLKTRWQHTDWAELQQHAIT